MPYAREAPTSVRMVAGGVPGFRTITQLQAPDPALALATGLALCSRLGAALLNVAASTLRPRETRLARSILADLWVCNPIVMPSYWIAAPLDRNLRVAHCQLRRPVVLLVPVGSELGLLIGRKVTRTESPPSDAA